MNRIIYLVSPKFKFKFFIVSTRDETTAEVRLANVDQRFATFQVTPHAEHMRGDLKRRERWLILISHAIGKVMSASVFGLQAKGTCPDWIRIVPQGLAEFWAAGTQPGDGQLRVHRKNGTMEKNMLQMACVATINSQFRAEHFVRKHWTPRVVMMPTL